MYDSSSTALEQTLPNYSNSRPRAKNRALCWPRTGALSSVAIRRGASPYCLVVRSRYVALLSAAHLLLQLSNLDARWHMCVWARARA